MSQFLLLVLFPFTFICAQTHEDSTLHELPELLFLVRDLTRADVKQLIETHKLKGEATVAIDNDTLYAIKNSSFLQEYPVYFEAYHFYQDTLYQIDCSPKHDGDAAIFEQRLVNSLNELIGLSDNYEIDEDDGTNNYWYLYSLETVKLTHLYQVRNLPYKENPIEVSVTHLVRFERMEEFSKQK